MSRIIDCAQGTPEWHAARLGIPTASQFHRIITAQKGDLSKSASKYAYELVAEIMLGRSLDSAGMSTFAMQRGKELEPAAVQQYAFSTEAEVRAVGFVTTDDGLLGCSPDRLIVGAPGGMEVKCVGDASHIGYLMDGPGDDYKQQVQGCLAVCEADWWDFYAYHPELPPVLLRTYRDDAYIARIAAALRQFLDMRDAMLLRARSYGWAEQMQMAA